MHAYYHNRLAIIEIFNAEHISLPPSTSFQHRYSHWKMAGDQTSMMVDLTRKIMDEVQTEAKRIRLGDNFDSFEEFDRCLHSWGVIECRAYYKFKTKFNCLVRVCQYGSIRQKTLVRNKKIV